ncbi:hypothetical protein OEZ85_005199 [Tetradesmus obliquus]|uniref:Pherophorin domain-containing protein n=1 Tax=Tetradesmus obliquus TaxID=3088 RepID=A0ABY8UHK1_TETOB|nr:hypothetical protein OEZ85_005199 [Tetradesmus obliquus]
MARVAIIASCCLLLIASASAYPTFWVAEDEVANDCLAHPAKKEARHGAPVADKTTTFKVTSAGVPATAVCPGVKYDVLVDFGASPRRALLTASAGTLGRGASPCLNRAYTSKEESAEPTFADVLTVPCTGAATAVNLFATSATGSSGAFQEAKLTLPINALAKCPASTCPGAPKAAAAAAAANTTAAALPGAAVAAAAGPAEANASAPAAAPAAKSGAGVAGPAGLVAVVLSAAALFMA